MNGEYPCRQPSPNPPIPKQCHDDMMETDARFLALVQDPAFLARRGLPLDEQQRLLEGRWVSSDLVSFQCLKDFYNCVGVQLATLTMVIALYVSLSGGWIFFVICIQSSIGKHEIPSIEFR